MRDSIRQVALDIIIIGGALCVIGGFVLIVQWIWISATWMQVTHAIKRTTQQVIDGLLHPIKLLGLFLEYWLASSTPETSSTQKTKKKTTIKAKKA